MRTSALLATALLVAACATDGNAVSQPGEPRACVAGPVQRFVGQPATPKLVERVRRLSISAVARRITPNMRVTMEFRADRVNVWVGLKDEVERVSCG